jgi:hypothetical protein
MISCAVDEAGRVLALTYSGRIGLKDMLVCFDKVKVLAPRLKPGFLLLSDMSNLESMEPECASILGEMMEFSSSGGVAEIWRVVPDQSKDIGLGLIARFHLHPSVKVQVDPNLAEAVASFMAARTHTTSA